MEFDNSKLRGKIRELFGTEQKFSDAVGISKSALSAKLNNNSEINRDEMLKMIDLLNIEKEDIFEIFFLTI
jgi:conserved domain protein